ncbi:hypothetical protein ACOSP7_032571 [Xanthoceras sorbifolium]|uniref:MBD domain-containing protein n=1 Tax=Xanthoceras sorbifolium TaxID=99658 RepID=A0ABQ8H465_9ROSI|nr:hypothetical protein JRO89_XS14G0066600 [Xanthoceras sorbifolium]KAH7548103.1 hypothetical protein JRO89_XS14G0067300 [Xanthoceras sorbifolium]
MENNSAERPNEPAANNSSTTADVNNSHRYEARIFSRASMTTLAKILERRRGGRRPSNRARSFFYDNSCPVYSWLLPGWVAEDRHMDHGRVYRYFYDPSGSQYRTQDEVLHAWAESGLIILDL